jgi:hypothetical protein
MERNNMGNIKIDQNKLQKEYGSVLSYFSTPNFQTDTVGCPCLSNKELDDAFHKLLSTNDNQLEKNNEK